MNIGRLGVFFFTDTFTAPQAAQFAQKLERLGYGALWFPEAVGRNTFVQASWLLAKTEKLVVASGIANIFARDAQATVAGQKALQELSDNRYLLGLGVSHKPLVTDLRGHVYEKPLTRMRNYLEAMKKAVYQAPEGEGRGEVVIGALGPKMTQLSAELTDGAHPYNVTPDHTAWARELIGPDKKLYVEQKVILESDAVKARQAAREALEFYLPMPNYQRNWERLGFSQQDYSGMSDRFLDAMVAWGTAETITKRLQEHWDAGADHVCIQPVGSLEPTLEALSGLNQHART